MKDDRILEELEKMAALLPVRTEHPITSVVVHPRHKEDWPKMRPDVPLELWGGLGIEINAKLPDHLVVLKSRGRVIGQVDLRTGKGFTYPPIESISVDRVSAEQAHEPRDIDPGPGCTVGSRWVLDPDDLWNAPHDPDPAG